MCKQIWSKCKQTAKNESKIEFNLISATGKMIYFFNVKPFFRKKLILIWYHIDLGNLKIF